MYESVYQGGKQAKEDQAGLGFEDIRRDFEDGCFGARGGYWQTGIQYQGRKRNEI